MDNMKLLSTIAIKYYKLCYATSMQRKHIRYDNIVPEIFFTDGHRCMLW